MTGVVATIRRSTVLKCSPLLLGVVLFSLVNLGEWRWEWALGLRYPLTGMALAAPLVGGLVAHDVSQRWALTRRGLGESLARWRLTTCQAALPGIVVMSGVLAVVWLGASAVMALSGAAGAMDPWVVPEVLAASCAAVAVGLLLGVKVDHRIAGPLAAVVLYVGVLVGSAYGMPALFTGMGAVSSLLGLERSPQAALISIALNLALCAACVTFSIAGDWWTPVRRVMVAVVCCTLVCVTAVSMSQSASDLEFRARKGEICRGHDLVVCGSPDSSSYLLTVADGLAAVRQDLARSGLDFPDEFVLMRPGLAVDTQRAVIELPPGLLFSDDGPDALTQALARPRVCPQLVEDGADPQPMLDAEEVVGTWLRDQRARGLQERAPMHVAAAFDDLKRCETRP